MDKMATRSRSDGDDECLWWREWSWCHCTRYRIAKIVEYAEKK